MMTVLQLLTEARALIADIKHWTQLELANGDGGSLWPNDKKATCWCGDGALRKVLDIGGADPEADSIYWQGRAALEAAAIKKFTVDCTMMPVCLYIAINDGEIGIPEEMGIGDASIRLAHTNILSVFDGAIVEAA